MISEAQRRAIYADFLDPIWGAAPDHQIADAHGVTPGDVRTLRAEHRRDLGVAKLAGRLEELSELIAWPGSPGELLAACVEAALMRAQAREHREGHASPMARHRAAQEAQRAAEVETATLDTERPAAAPCEPTSVDGGSPAVPQTGAPGSGAVRAAVDRLTPDPADTSSSLVSGNEKSVPTATLPRNTGSSSGAASTAVQRSGPWVQSSGSQPTRHSMGQRSLSGS